VPVRVSAAVTLGVCLTPVVVRTAPVVSASTPGIPYVAQVCSELAVGAAFGFAAATVVWAAMLAGQAIDAALGLQPPDEGTPPVATLYGLAAAILLLSGSGYRWLLSGILGSFRAIPPGHVPRLSSFTAGFSALPGEALVAAVWIAAPALSAIILGDIAAAVATRCAPALAASGLNAATRWIVAVAAICVSLPLLAVHVPHLIESVSRALQALIGT
jgi:flagellar biosynthetic protein FliR